jgi:hypothetical protein
MRAFAACNAAGLSRLREIVMLKVAAIATLGWSLAMCVGNACAVEMSMPTGDFAHGSGGGAGEVDSTTATARDVGAAGAMHNVTAREGEAEVFVSAHERTPDSATVTRSDDTRATLGTDTASPANGAPAHKARRNAHWQSLLPGVMK